MSIFGMAVSIGTSRLDGRFVATLVGVTAPLVAVAALVARRAIPYRAANETLLGAVFGVAVPLAVYAIVSRSTGRGRFERVTEAAARHGASRRSLTLGLLGACALVGIVAASVFVVVGLSVARGPGDPSLTGDCVTSLRIAVAATIAYTAWFALGSTFGRAGGGRFVALVADWFFGSSTGWLGVPTPRAHIANLLGAEPVLGWSQPVAFAMLAALTIVAGGFALWRTAP